MRPVKLELDGFAAYRTKATVEFCDTDFFVLVGPTGSGKSTVIDAMVFALYGTVPRWGERNLVAPALAPTVNRGVVHLIFDAGGKRYAVARDIRRSGRKNPTVTVREARLEQFVSPDATGGSEDETVTIATGRAVSASVEQILGLNFEQFTQSVALPQGEFARFLHAPGADRQAILKNLLGYNVYELIQSAAYARASDCKSKADTLADQLDSYADATEEEIDSLSARLDELDKFQRHVTTVSVPELKAAAEAALAARESLDRLTTERDQLLAVSKPDGVDELDEKRRARAAGVESAETAKRALEERDEQIREAIRAARPRHELEQITSNWRELSRIEYRLPGLKEQAAEAQTVQVAATEAHAATEVAVRCARDTAADATRAADATQQQLQTTQAHSGLIEALQAPEDIDVISESLKNAIESLNDARSTLTTGEAAQQSATDELDGLPGSAALTAAKTSVDEVHGAIMQDIAQCAARTAAQEAVEKARTESETKANQLLLAEQALRDVEHANQAAALRADLHAGDDCPVCGQAISEIPSDVGKVDLPGARAKVEAAKASADKSQSEAAELESAHRDATLVRSERLRRCEAVRAALVQQLSDLVMTESLAALARPIEATPSEEQLTALAADASSAQLLLAQTTERRSAAEDKRRAADAAVGAARQAVRSAEKALGAAQEQTSRARATLHAARDTVSALEPPSIDDTDIAAAWEQLANWAKSQLKAVKKHLATLTKAAKEAETTAARTSDELEKAEAAATHTVNAFHTASLAKQKADTDLETAEQRKSELTALLAEAPTSEDASAQLEEVKALQLQLDDVASQLTEARAEATATKDALVEAETAIATSWQHLRRERDPLAGFGAPEVAGNDLTGDWDLLLGWAAVEAQARSTNIKTQQGNVTQADARTDATAQALSDGLSQFEIELVESLAPVELAEQAPAAVASSVATAKGELKRAKERRRQSENIQAEMKQARESADVAQSLSNLMRANQFQRWLIGSALDALLRDASLILLELSGGQFELTRTEQDLMVIDHNDADMSRLVKTLSGGETFQASLALALALSEQVTSLSTAGASKLESIFLDEGFGTLDEATLDVVAGTLENLASSGSRMVGVITHVGALAERIPVRFEVTRDSAGSHIERIQV
jgi:exonuclease SbcC